MRMHRCARTDRKERVWKGRRGHNLTLNDCSARWSVPGGITNREREGERVLLNHFPSFPTMRFSLRYKLHVEGQPNVRATLHQTRDRISATNVTQSIALPHNTSHYHFLWAGLASGMSTYPLTCSVTGYDWELSPLAARLQSPAAWDHHMRVLCKRPSDQEIKRWWSTVMIWSAACLADGSRRQWCNNVFKEQANGAS